MFALNVRTASAVFLGRCSCGRNLGGGPLSHLGCETVWYPYPTSPETQGICETEG
jgi:hypothetical protein